MLKKILLLFILIITFFLLKLVISPTFIISNNTSQLIRFSNAQFFSNQNDGIDESDIQDLKTYYRVRPNSQRRHYLYLRKITHFSQKIDLSFTFYVNNSQKSFGFSESSFNINQESYCVFNVDVYSDDVVITPLKTSKWCLRPVYLAP